MRALLYRICLTPQGKTSSIVLSNSSSLFFVCSPSVRRSCVRSRFIKVFWSLPSCKYNYTTTVPARTFRGTLVLLASRIPRLESARKHQLFLSTFPSTATPAMAVSAMELEQLKRKLLVQYGAEIARLSSPESGATTSEEAPDQPQASAVPSPLPSASSLSLQLLCLRAGRSLKDGPVTTQELIALMASTMPPPDVLVEERLRCAQDESVRLLAKRTHTLMGQANSGADKHQDEKDGGRACGDPHDASAPFTSAERLQLLEEMYASNVQALAASQASVLEVADNGVQA